MTSPKDPNTRPKLPPLPTPEASQSSRASQSQAATPDQAAETGQAAGSQPSESSENRAATSHHNPTAPPVQANAAQGQPSGANRQTTPPSNRDGAAGTTGAELPAAIDMESSTVSEAALALLGVFRYATSLPERTFRSASALAGGLVRESSHWLVPSAFRNSKSYTIFVRQMLDFVVSDVGGVRRPLTKGENTSTEHVDLARKTVGNLFDMTALATFHMSPITVLAIFSDVAYGSKVYLEQLTIRLREDGIIEQNSAIHNSLELIDAIQRAAGDAADVFEQPPISIASLKRTVQEAYQAIADVEPAKVLPLTEIDQLWRQMQLAAQQQNASLWDISATISIVALNNISTAAGVSKTGLEVAGNMFQQEITDHYWEGLRKIERDGLIATLSSASEPYLDAIWTNFSMDRKTWTEQLISGELIKWGWSQWSWPKLSRH